MASSGYAPRADLAAAPAVRGCERADRARVAYRVTGTPADDLHGYLAHAPQVVLILATLALLGLAADARARRSSPLPLALLAIGAFVAQEHLERLIHTGRRAVPAHEPGAVARDRAAAPAHDRGLVARAPARG